MVEWSKKIYPCQNKACLTPSREFEDREEGFFFARGDEAPTNCFLCRDWNNAQKREGIQSTNCSSCGEPIAVTSGRRIMHHKKDGPWEILTKCLRCLANPKIAKRQERRRLARKNTEKARQQFPKTAIPVLPCEQDPEQYKYIIHEKHGITAEEHIFYGSAYGKRGQDEFKGKLRWHKWPEIGVTTPRRSVMVAIQIAGRTDAAIEFFLQGSRMIKILSDGEVSIRLVWEAELQIVTCYPEI